MVLLNNSVDMATLYPTYKPVPFDHTYILYDPNDIISMISVHLSLLPIYIMVFYTSWFLITREIEPVIIVGGHLCNEVANKIVKRLFKHPRPNFHKDFGIGSYSLTYGMPSAHSQFMAFFAAYFICILMFKIDHLSSIQKWAGYVSLITTAILVAFSRVYLLYHIIPQVAVGVMLGFVLGLLFFVVSSIARDCGIVDLILDWPIVKVFFVKDSYYHTYRSFKDEYHYYLLERKAFKQKLMKKFL